MSEPITRADYAKWLLSCGDLEMHAMFEDWCAHNPAESASPPRVPGPSAQFAKVGVQSGPGQPTDLINDCNDLASKYESTHPDFAVVMRKMAVEIKRIRQEAKDEHRAGVEAALQAIETMLATSSRSASQHTVLNEAYDTIRALAAALPVDPRLAGLKYALQLIEGGRQSVYADSTWDAAAHRRSGDKYVALLKAEIAACRGG